MSIIVQIIGGVGNQLFQYAFARSMAAKRGTDFKFDISPLDTDFFISNGYGFFLNRFNIKKTELAKDKDLYGLVWLVRHSKIFNFIHNKFRLRYFLKHFFYHEESFSFISEVFQKKALYFEGFWQSEKYFKDIADEIREEISLKENMSEHSQAIDKEISRTKAISLHIRRYAHENSKPWFGFCSLEYYKKAAEIIVQKMPDAHFFIFSDNYDWVRENFKDFDHPYTLVENSNEQNCDDIILMSHCKHHIIANSSFSWWGAWLNPSPTKIVIAPKVWFAHAKKNNTKDLLPEEWIKI